MTTATLVTLTGSEKQITWAETIRTEFTAKAAAFIADLEARAAKVEKTEANARAFESLEIAKKAVSYLSKQPAASFWIDSRRSLTTDLSLEITIRIKRFRETGKFSK